MRPYVHTFTLGLVSMCLANCGNHVWDQFREDFHSSYPLSAGARLEVENPNGPVDIWGWDQNNVDVSGTKYASSPDRLKQIKIDVIPATGSLSIRTIRPGAPWENTGVHYVLRVPRGVKLDRVFTSNGSIQVNDIDAGANLRTSNGPVRVFASKGAIEVSTSNGPVRVTDASGPATLRTHNGPIELTLDSVHEVLASTSNGPITLRIPSDAGATLHARTTIGPIHSDFDLSAEDRISRNHLDGTIGPGGPLLDLSTSNGPIRVLQR